MFAYMEAMSSFYDQFKNSQFEEKKLCNLREKVFQSDARESIHDYESVLRIRGRSCIPQVFNLI